MKTKLPTSESEFYQTLRDETLSSIYWERLELKTDSGFPDSHFVLRTKPSDKTVEGTVEFKFDRSDKPIPDIRKLLEATQIANFLEYYQAGGRNRLVLCCNKQGKCFLYSTERIYDILRGKKTQPSTGTELFAAEDDDTPFPLRSWLPVMLEMFSGRR